MLCGFSPDGNENPTVKKLFFHTIAERPAEAPEIVLEKKLFERGVVMNSWKLLLIQSKRRTQSKVGNYNFEVSSGCKIY